MASMNTVLVDGRCPVHGVAVPVESVCPACLGQEIRFLGDLQRLDLRPGDRFVLTVPRQLSYEQRARLSTAFREEVGAPVLVLEEGIKLGVIGAALPDSAGETK